MPRPVTNSAKAVWNGDLKSGSGTTSLETSQLGTFPTHWKARSEESERGTTSPEELIGAALATCFSMQFSNMLAENGTPPPQSRAPQTSPSIVAEGGITGIELINNSTIENIDEADFQRLANEAKETCPVSKALQGVEITLNATLA